jgi:hypothetical protein
MSDYTLDDWGSIPGGGKGFSSSARIGNPVANLHKRRIGHESVATQPKFL